MEITPFENDTALAALLSKAATVANQIDRYERTIETASEYSYGQRNAAEAEAQLPKLRDKLAALRAERAPFEAEYAARRWSRFFLVTNGNGHVHSSMSCSTCYPTTEFAWLPELAGKTEAEMVDEFGEKACTVCFPTAPANPKFHIAGRRDRVALFTRQAEKDAKLAAKLEKALLPDGSELRLPGGERPKTLISAQRTLSSTLQSLYSYNVMYAEVHGRTEPHPYTPKWEADVALLIEAISNKTGQPADEILAEAKAKAEKKVRKEWA